MNPLPIALKSERRGWCYPMPVRRFAERLISQQLWCFGCDIKHARGNLLRRYGFSRHRSKEVVVSLRQSGLHGSSLESVEYSLLGSLSGRLGTPF